MVGVRMVARAPARSIIAIHMLDTYTGSARIFSDVVGELQGRSDVLVVLGGGEGLISEKCTVHKKFSYSLSGKRWLVALKYLSTTASIFFYTTLSIVRKSRNSTDIVVYANAAPSVGGIFAALVCRKRVVFHLHEVTIRPRWLGMVVRRLSRSHLVQTVFVSDFMKNHVGGEFGSALVVSNPVSRDLWTSSESYSGSGSFKEKPLVVAMVGSVKEEKGVFEFITAAKILAPLGMFRFILVGDDYMGGRAIRSWIDRLDAYGAIEWRPPTTRIESVYQEIDVLVNNTDPARWVETFGLSVAEARCFGKPAIVTAGGACEEMVSDGIDGYVIEYGDTDQLVDRLHRLADTENYVRMAKASRAKSRGYSPDVFTKRILSLFKLEKRT